MRAIASLRIISFFILPLLVFLTGCAEPNSWMETDEEYALDLNLSTNRIYVGQIVDAELDILHPADTQPSFTEPGDDDEITVRDRSWDSEVLEDGRQLTSIQYRLTSFELGEHRVFSDGITFMCGEELAGGLDFPDSVISVESVLKGGAAELRPIADCVEFAPRFPRWLPVLILVAVLAALLGAIVSRLLRRREKAVKEPVRPPAHEIALRELQLLWQKGWIEENAAEPFYIELSRIVRNYIEDRFNLRAPEQTTEEFIRDASESEHLSPEHRQLTADFLRQSDMVKFARYQPAADAMKEAFDSAECLVRETSTTEQNTAGGVEQ